jgi:hypothetical protein
MTTLKSLGLEYEERDISCIDCPPFTGTSKVQRIMQARADARAGIDCFDYNVDKSIMFKIQRYNAF